MDSVSAEARAGARVLGEIEETSLDEILAELRHAIDATNTTTISKPITHNVNKSHSSYPIPGLDALVARQRQAAPASPLQLTGRYLHLIYALISTLIAAPHLKTVVVIDLEDRFDATRLTVGSGPNDDADHDKHDIETDTDDPLRHVHVYRPARSSIEHLRDVIAAAEHRMLYGRHDSRTREWWGTIVIGAPLAATTGSSSAAGRPSSSVQVTASWRGWMRVDRDEVRGFPLGAGVGEVLADRERRQAAVDEAPWTASCAWGSIVFQEKGAAAAKDEPPLHR
ncbi:hypothetical protein VD0002_g1023 [Verticillium dahliae]|uniref:Uncharacterized protein n=1 Tax=Verticillium dahliae TaxID=27337 RepID=A0A2J8F6D2_VERDA|nr:Cutinase transcription factor 1 alpha [Verticillium dahliae VDG2]PNH35843.1 hypothetical protein BJF96_g981 [Verticillium dahliae]PNH53653.1 hypothetical protein VD0003_g3782 [Verticillium dahliae]PNH69309.1 hypothetical protein VD0002_g1023 [Verticillium dahliae]RBQ99769.1 hypothetical protein VDGD_06697 [Verticillium dahliae]